jgi:hypothetical protein
MADFQTAFSWIMTSEDPHLTYATGPDAPNQWQLDSSGNPVLDAYGNKIRIGAFAISGINSLSYPVQFHTINNIPQSQRGPAVQHFYQTVFWNKWYGLLSSDDIAKRVYDEAVNSGPATGVEILQKAVNAVTGTPSLDIDGDWGPETVASTNAADPTLLLEKFIAARVAHYEGIVARNPQDSIYLEGWLARARK